MNNTFELKKGTLVFEEDRIVITDNAKTLRYSRIFSLSILLLLGFSSFIKYLKVGDSHSLMFGLIAGLAGLLSLAFVLFTSVRSEIDLKDVKSMKVRRFFFREFFEIKLTNNKARQVAGIYNAERLEEYIATISLPNK